jgi:hypothetical protein
MSGAEAEKKMLPRFIHSFIFGLGLATCLATILLVGLWLYLRFFWTPAHAGFGAVAGGLDPTIWLTSPAFVVGFFWDWRRSSGN